VARERNAEGISMARPMSGESVFRAMAHATRRKILLSLRAGERAAGDLLPPRELAKPSLSDHLRALQLAGLVTYRRRGTSLVYRLNRGALRPVEQFMETMNNAARHL
jgi:ArsR family transcriptional regulator